MCLLQVSSSQGSDNDDPGYFSGSDSDDPGYLADVSDNDVDEDNPKVEEIKKEHEISATKAEISAKHARSEDLKNQEEDYLYRKVKKPRLCDKGKRRKRSICIPSQDDVKLKEESVFFHDDIMKFTIYDKNNPSIEVK